MKSLSLSILLLCLLASNAQAFAPWEWIKQNPVAWVQENKKKAIAGTVGIGLASCLGYKAHKTYPDLTILKATQKLIAENNWAELLDAEKLTGKDSWPLYIVNAVGLSFLFSQRVLPSVFNTVTVNFDKYFNKNFYEEEKFKLRFTTLRSQRKDILDELKVYKLQITYTPNEEIRKRNDLKSKIDTCAEKFADNRQEETTLRSQAKNLLGTEKANKMFNEFLNKNS